MTFASLGLDSSMLHMKYNKLIRDGIPGIIKDSGGTYETHVAGPDEYGAKLMENLNEEVGEFGEDPTVGELADVLEVVRAIAEFKFGGMGEVERVRAGKAEERGGFEKRIILDWSER